jgi:hypothetical protein
MMCKEEPSVADTEKKAQTTLTASAAKKPLQGIYDPEIDLGYQLKTADAASWGRDYKQLANNASREKRLLVTGHK